MPETSLSSPAIAINPDVKVSASRWQPTSDAVIIDLHHATDWLSWHTPAISLRIESYLSHPSNYRRFSQHGKAYIGAEQIPTARAKSIAFDEVLEKRTSKRNLKDGKFSSVIIGGVLQTAAGRSRRAVLAPGYEVNHAAYPSAGGLFPVNIYVIWRNGTGLPSPSYSAWHFDNVNARLCKVRGDVDAAEVKRALGFGRKIPSFGAAIFLTGTFGRSTSKYGNRGYRFALLEAGHVAQNILLTCEALALGGYCHGGYTDDDASKMLRLDGHEEFPLHCIFIGEQSLASSDAAEEL